MPTPLNQFKAGLSSQALGMEVVLIDTELKALGTLVSMPQGSSMHAATGSNTGVGKGAAGSAVLMSISVAMPNSPATLACRSKGQGDTIRDCITQSPE